MEYLAAFDAGKFRAGFADTQRVCDRYGLAPSQAEPASGDTLSEPLQQARYEQQLAHFIRHHPVDFETAACGPQNGDRRRRSFSIERAYTLQDSSEHWRSYHWKIAAHTPLTSRIYAGPLRSAKPLYAADTNPAVETASKPTGTLLSLYASIRRTLGFRPKARASEIPAGLRQVGERYGNMLVLGDQTALQAFRRAREYLCTDPMTHSEFMTFEDGLAPKYEALSGDVKEHKKNFTIVLAESADNVASSAIDLSRMKSFYPLETFVRQHDVDSFFDPAQDSQNWARHKLLQAEIPLHELEEDHKVCVVPWNYLKGSFCSPEPPYYQTPSLALKHELRHVRNDHENYLRQNVARMQTKAGLLNNREELMTIREENRMAVVKGEASRFTHCGSPHVDMPDTVSWPSYLNDQKIIDFSRDYLAKLSDIGDVKARDKQRLKKLLDSSLVSGGGHREYLLEQLRALDINDTVSEVASLS